MDSPDMDKLFRDLEKAGKTDVDNLIQWMKNSKIMESTREDKVRKLFADLKNQQKVELEQFKKIVSQVAEEEHKTFTQLSKQLVAEAPKIIDAAIEGLNAFKEALKAGK